MVHDVLRYFDKNVKSAITDSSTRAIWEKYNIYNHYSGTTSNAAGQNLITSREHSTTIVPCLNTTLILDKEVQGRKDTENALYVP